MAAVSASSLSFNLPLFVSHQVEIVMGLEEEFDMSVEEENSQNITNVQEAADLIEKLVQQNLNA